MERREVWPQQSRENAAPLGRSPWPVPDLAVEDDAAGDGPRTRVISYLADCECPDDCLRDHENE